MALEIGQLAPEFTLQNQDGETVSLAEFRGKKNVVVYFYPKAMTPGCTTQACGIRDTNQQYAELDTVVLGISPDAFPRLAKFRDKHDLNFTLLSDEDHGVAEAYGVWALKKFMGREFMGVVRSTFIIDKQGRVAHCLEKFKTNNHHDVLLDALRAL